MIIDCIILHFINEIYEVYALAAIEFKKDQIVQINNFKINRHLLPKFE